MAGVVAVVGGHPREQVLKILAGHQVAVGQRGAAEIGQQRVARAVDMDLMATWHLDCIEHGGLLPICSDGVSAAMKSLVNQHVAHHSRSGHNIHVCCGHATPWLRRNRAPGAESEV
jgi:hypothetical protein